MTSFEPPGLALENEALRRRVQELEHALASSSDAARFLESILAIVPAFITRTDSDLCIRYINACQSGLSPEQVVGRSILDFIDPEDRERSRTQFEGARTSGEIRSVDAQGVRAHGQATTYHTRATALPGLDGTTGLCVAMVEMTALKQRDQALKEAETKLRVALAATGLGFWSWDALSGEMVWDEAMRKLHGCEVPATLETYIDRIVHDADRSTVLSLSEQLLESGRLESSSYRINRPDGEVRWLLSSATVVSDAEGSMLKIMGGTLDVTEHRVLEEHLRQAQKMEAIGSLAAGIAHNFNNMLSVIMPTLDLVAPFVPDQHRALSRDASHASRRAAELVRQLMTFGRAPCSERAAHDILEIVDAAVGICRRAFEHRMVLYTIYEAPPATVFCNAGQIEQVLVNLLLNARDAVKDAGLGRGRVTVRVTTHGPSLPPLTDHEPARPSVCIQVSDDGAGMSEEARNKAFEPFFTTKGDGGTGLGLATSLAIVRDHQGSIECRSQAGAGTTFTIALPLSERPIEFQPSPVSEPIPKRIGVLLVDDEAAIRVAVGHVLEDAEIRVVCANNGGEALARLVQKPDIDVVMLDRSMPDGPGESFIPRMRQLAPRARIMFFSGETIEPEVAMLADAIVQKPVHGRELLDAISRVLRAGAGTGEPR
jgi:PAS domain S-box-containing protein